MQVGNALHINRRTMPNVHATVVSEKGLWLFIFEAQSMARCYCLICFNIELIWACLASTCTIQIFISMYEIIQHVTTIPTLHFQVLCSTLDRIGFSSKTAPPPTTPTFVSRLKSAFLVKGFLLWNQVFSQERRPPPSREMEKMGEGCSRKGCCRNKNMS